MKTKEELVQEIWDMGCRKLTCNNNVIAFVDSDFYYNYDTGIAYGKIIGTESTNTKIKDIVKNLFELKYSKEVIGSKSNIWHNSRSYDIACYCNIPHVHNPVEPFN